jgi:alginate O-acetyltransferase complex protein AlgI
MLFNSLPYLFFLTAVSAILYLIPSKYQWLWLLVCSAFFYYTLLPLYLILFFVLIFLNYYFGIAIERSEQKRNFIFVLSVSINIIVLAFFKYFGFFQSLTSKIKELSVNDHLLMIILPVGLSFFIFTVLSYLIEIKRGTIKAEKHLGIFASSLMFFPKIMQGPIERPGNIFPQFREEKCFNYDMVSEGLKLILWGLFKKLVVADRLAIYVNAVYGNYEHHSGITLLVATIFYSFQIYADFSGYTDIALGSAKVLGFNLTNNFNRPYFSTSIKEFWNRWHISFSLWLRDYLFLPMAVFFAGEMKRTKYLGLAVEKWIFLFATMITFAVCGIWHGEGINFLIWGLVFGVYLTLANWTFGFNKKLRKIFGISKKSKFYKVYGISATFILVTFAWVFFRSGSLQESIVILQKIFTFQGSFFIGSPAYLIYSLFSIIILVSVEMKTEYFKTSISFFHHSKVWVRNLSYTFLVLMILLIGVFDEGQFIYFQF